MNRVVPNKELLQAILDDVAYWLGPEDLGNLWEAVDVDTMNQIAGIPMKCHYCGSDSIWTDWRPFECKACLDSDDDEVNQKDPWTVATCATCMRMCLRCGRKCCPNSSHICSSCGKNVCVIDCGGITCLGCDNLLCNDCCYQCDDCPSWNGEYMLGCGQCVPLCDICGQHKCLMYHMINCSFCGITFCIDCHMKEEYIDCCPRCANGNIELSQSVQDELQHRILG